MEAGLFVLFKNDVDESNRPEQKPNQLVRSFRKDKEDEGNNESKDKIRNDTVSAISEILIRQNYSPFVDAIESKHLGI